MNRLASEKSPYLLMHASNPVDWYPWGEAAFEAARSKDAPIFLSVGYSACHWCHVIARESFEDASIADALNADYISIKVDKEERPDVDKVYMDAVEMATGAGGWPMTLILTPECEPFFAATYLPKDALAKLLADAAEMWRHRRSQVNEAAAEFTRALRARAQSAPAPQAPGMALARAAVNQFSLSYDEKWGGFGRAPKFPAAHNILFLLEYHKVTGDSKALAMATGTLNAMAAGGIFDHIGGGFCRYSVDRKWLTPHFEKMLYDNALLIWAYSEAWRATQNPNYRDVAVRTADYALAEMTGREGEFYSSQDADSEGKEGAYYLFKRAELIELLGGADGNAFCDWYGITDAPNFEGESIPNRAGMPFDARTERDMAPLRARVYAYRRARRALKRDDKALTAWNALMITALCAAARALGDKAYLAAARSAEEYLRARMTTEDGGLKLWRREGAAGGAGVLDDYAYYALALTELYSIAGGADYMRRAEALAKDMLSRFGDASRAGLYLYDARGEQLITRPVETWDAAMPSGNSCAALALINISKRSQDDYMRAQADRQLRFVAGAAQKNPTGHGFGLFAIMRALGDLSD